MKRGKNITWGIILIIAGVAAVLLAVFPELGIASVPLWKWCAGALLLYWLLKKLIFGENLREHFDIFIPLALLFLLFEKNIAPLIGKEENFVNNWLILGAALLLTAAIYLLFPHKWVIGKKNGHHNRMSESTVYLDASENEPKSVSNSFGEMNVYYQNTDVGDTEQPVRLYAKNSFGELVIHVPADWCVKVKASNALGELSVRDNIVGNGREFILEGSNSFGEISVVSP